VKILLADDSVTAQNMGKKILSEAGHEVVCVNNGAAALKKVSEQEPDLVILDIYMPGYSGLEVCQRLKEGPATASLPVVLTVGKLEPFRKEDAQRVRAEALIVKPFEASELAAAVGRFGEMAAANPPKGKGRGKLGPPQSKPKPQWDEPSPDEFVTTTQKLEEEGYMPGSPNTSPAAKDMETKAQAQAPAADEFEVAPAPEGPEVAGAAQAATEPREDLSRAGARITETPAPVGAPAEFDVHAAADFAAQEQASPKAAAAAAGADFGGSAEMREFPVGSSSPQGFEVTAPSEAKAPEPAAFTSQIASDVPNFPAAPEMSATAAPEFSAAADSYAGPGVDPAFSADRTQWATEFPTRFGIAEPAESAADEAERPAEAQPEPEAASAPTDEIAAILSSFPGSSFSTEPPRHSDEGGSFGERPWPVEGAGPEKETWQAEEVPVEDRDSSISLAEEMEKASIARGLEGVAQPSIAEGKAQTPPEDLSPTRIVESQEEEIQQLPATVESSQPNAAEESVSAVAPPTVEESHSSPFLPETKTEPAAPDQVAGVMQSAAMAIATRATVSAVASQLHQQPAENASTGSSAIEELVGQVLERLKPKLIAEIKRELKSNDQ
jgi:CheY-like chemotaxis protein